MIIERAITKKHIEDRFDKLQSMLRDIMIEKKENKELIKACQKISFLLDQEKETFDSNRYFSLSHIFQSIPKGKTFGDFKILLASFSQEVEVDFQYLLEQHIVQNERENCHDYYVFQIRSFIKDLGDYPDLKEELVNYLLNDCKPADDLIKIGGVDFLSLVNAFSFSIMMAYNALMEMKEKSYIKKVN